MIDNKKKTEALMPENIHAISPITGNRFILTIYPELSDVPDEVRQAADEYLADEIKKEARKTDAESKRKMDEK